MTTQENKSVSELIKQFKPSDLIVIAGNSGVGKTTLALDILMKEAIENQKPIAIFPLEMDKRSIMARIFSCTTGINLSQILKHEMTLNEVDILAKKAPKLDSYPMYIDDSTELSITEIKNHCLELIKLHSVETVIIDGLQYIKFTENIPINQLLKRTLNDLKDIAKELNIKIIVSFNTIERGVFTSSNADHVIVCMRPEWDSIFEYKTKEDTFDTSSLLVLHLGKKTKENLILFSDKKMLLRIDNSTLKLTDAITIENKKQSNEQTNSFKLPKVDKEKIERFDKLSSQQNKEFNRMVLKSFFKVIVNLFAIVGFIGLILQLTGVIKLK